MTFYDKGKTPFQNLEREARYALNSQKRDLVFECYGAAKMARSHDLISKAEFDSLNEILIRKGVNDPANCKLR